ncbi:MAG: hypothetical protein ACI9FN_002152 [Saprospiraceae bacterium]|jgi:hypothetical protein
MAQNLSLYAGTPIELLPIFSVADSPEFLASIESRATE